ncbi:MAG: aminotransferase class V-fold PLP-dependent enzyme [Planctomycetota bacterium]|nr:aminotransferase class V-fold PLP-dependent enzyme [Planctomycetota bacterium]
MFDKSQDLFPIKKEYAFLTHCSISPLYSRGFQKELEMAEEHQNRGALFFDSYDQILDNLRAAAAKLFRTSEKNLAFVKNTAEGICMLANGYPFEPGDQVLSYVHEYPSDHYPWRVQEQRGVELALLPNRDTTGGLCGGRACAWAMEDLEELVTDRTKIVALSHVQFTSGFAADLKELGEFCKARDIDLVVDAAQSLGCLPVYPEEWNIAAVASSGWKWLLGPVGTGLFYTSPTLREKLEHVMVGSELMTQGTDYLNHTWHPHDTAKRFEYSTSPISLCASLEVCINELPLRYGVENIRAEALRLQNILLNGIDRTRYLPVEFPDANRSGILSLVCKANPRAIARALKAQRIVTSSRGDFLRLAPHFYNTEEEIQRTIETMNQFDI